MLSRRDLLASAAAACATEPLMPADSVFEFRNYTTTPGKRDDLITLFEREFIESQEAVGAHVLGAFRNLDDPDRFVWMRGFVDMEARAAALNAFYTSPLWQSRRSEANASIVDSDNVLLLRPLGLPEQLPARAPIGASAISDSIILATTHFLSTGSDEPFAAFFAHDVAPNLAEMGAAPIARFLTEHAPNSFPRLPVRENETVFLTLTRFATVAAYEQKREALQSLNATFAPRLAAPTETLRLSSTARSLIR